MCNHDLDHELNSIIRMILGERERLTEAPERIAEKSARAFRKMIEQELKDVQEQLEKLKEKIKEATDETNMIIEEEVKRELGLKEVKLELDLNLRYVTSDIVDRIDELIKGFDPKFVEEMFFNLIKNEISEKFSRIIKALNTIIRKLK